MPRPKPNKLHDDLDALLDGRPVGSAASSCRWWRRPTPSGSSWPPEARPRVADRHLERVLEGSTAVVELPARSYVVAGAAG